MIYLASPYSHPDEHIRHIRYLEAERATAWLLSKSHWVFSPIVHCHFIALRYKMPTDADFWRRYNQCMIANSTSFCMLMIEGARDSVGMKSELEFAEDMDREVSLLIPDGEEFVLVTSLGDLYQRDPLSFFRTGK